MINLNPLKYDLHVHLLQALSIEDLYDLAKDIYHDINWNRFGFLDRYKKCFGRNLNPIAIFDEIKEKNSLEPLRKISVYKHSIDNSFQEFDIISFFPICITGYYFDKDEPEVVLDKIVKRYRSLDVEYVEFRNSFGSGGQIVKDWHARFARYLKEHSDDKLTMKYNYRIGSFKECLEMLDENPDIVDTVTAIDFSGPEVAPEDHIDFFESYHKEKKRNPNIPLLSMHIGEVFNDITFFSAIRRVHKAALFGVKRIAHAVILGINTEMLLDKNKSFYREETVRERLYQIQYDIEFEELLYKNGIVIDKSALIIEKKKLLNFPSNKTITYKYSKKDMTEIKKRQTMVLNELSKMDVIIEQCPTSNYIIGGFPSINEHSIHKILASNVDVVICTDDPGVFDITLEDEYKSLTSDYGYNIKQLKERVNKGLEKIVSI